MSFLFSDTTIVIVNFLCTFKSKWKICAIFGEQLAPSRRS